MNVLVDTNVISELKRGAKAAPRVVAWFATTAPQNVFTSVIVLGEIRRGIELDDRFQNSNHMGPPENAAFLRTEADPKLIGFMESLG